MDDNVVTFFFQHVVPLVITVEKNEQRVKKFITAFVMSVDDYWFLVTAGHCLKMVDEALDQGFKLVNAQLLDSLGVGAKDQNLVPFDYKRDSIIYFYEKGNFDYGFIPLSKYYVELLEVNKIRPFTEETWKKQPSSPIRYMLFGLPETLEQVDPNGISIAPTMLFVDKVEEKPEAFVESDFPFFYGKVLLPDNFKDIVGMSGGPILAVQEDKEGHLRYWIIALQSAWLQDSHFIKACPTYLLGDYLETVLKNSTS